MKYFPTIGLEVHVELATRSGMFCGCPADSFGKEPNTNVCPVCLGLPGALPVPNKKAIEWTIMLGLALGSKINLVSHFDRKNYSYPDLPKGYQISQNEKPFCVGGNLGEIRLNNIHLEEDTGKLIHQGDDTYVDFNRSGVPLVEIVTEPDFHNIDEVDIYLKKLQRIIRYLGISSADMEKGSMRLEPSISLTTDYNLPLPKYRVELKNINSFRFARRALAYEINRQTKILESGQIPTQETRGWNEEKGVTFPQRSKEEAHDYRYFPEPDIPPIVVSKEQLTMISQEIPELPDDKFERFKKQYSLSDYDANLLVEDKNTADFFEQALMDSKDITAKEIANWIINKKVNLEQTVPAQLVQMILQSKQKNSVNEEDLQSAIDKVLAENVKAVADYKAGKTQIIGFLIGQVSRLLQNSDPSLIRTALLKNL